MRTSLTSYFRSQIIDPNSSEVGVGLLDISCPSFTETYYVTDNNEDIVSNGITYRKYAFELAFIDEADGEIPSSNLLLDSTDTTLLEALATMDPRDFVTISYQFVAASDPDTNQLLQPITYKLSQYTADEASIVGSLVLALLVHEQFPAHGWYPSLVPGLFGGKV